MSPLHDGNHDGNHDGKHWIVVEKRTHTARHALCSSLSSAEHYIQARVPVYVAKRYLMNKALTSDCFCIITPTGDVVHVTPPAAHAPTSSQHEPLVKLREGPVTDDKIL